MPTFSLILDDMKEEGTFVKNYFLISYLLWCFRRNLPRPNGSRSQRIFTSKHIEFLGMALLTKKDGTFDDVVAPPGYALVGDEKYGRWREDNSGGSFWEFYGKYALISSLFGGWYSPIHRNDYRAYQGDRTRGKSFFGRNNQ